MLGTRTGLRCPLQNQLDRGANPVNSLPAGVGCCATLLVKDVDNATGVDSKVRAVKDAPGAKSLVVLIGGELVVGGTETSPARYFGWPQTLKPGQ